MARTASHRPYKFVEADEVRNDGYDLQKHFGRRPAAAEISREMNRRSRHQAREDIGAQRFDDLAPTGSGRHGGVWDAY